MQSDRGQRYVKRARIEATASSVNEETPKVSFDADPSDTESNTITSTSNAVLIGCQFIVYILLSLIRKYKEYN